MRSEMVENGKSSFDMKHPIYFEKFQIKLTTVSPIFSAIKMFKETGEIYV